MSRINTKKLKIGDVFIGGSNKILIQSMCNIKTSNVDQVVAQINECADLGTDLMRVSVLDYEDCEALKEINSRISIPLIADIHYNHEFALKAIENGCKKIRINPGNITNKEHLLKIIEKAKENNVVIRIGVNAGSLINEKDNNIETVDLICKTALEYINFFEKHGFYNLVISLKTSDVIETIECYKNFSKLSNYPLHIGLTESGFDDIGIIKSVSALSPLLLEGIGDTIRISLTGSPQKEILTCKRLLHSLNLYPNYPTLISCPTCGRTQVDIKTIAEKTLEFLEANHINKKVAIMGCPVNGIGEGKNADIGLAGGKNQYIIFKKGEIIKKISEEKALEALFEELLKD